MTADQLKGDPLKHIDEMIIQSHIACKAKDPTFNCDPTLEAVQSKYQELMNGFCDGGVANLDNLYQTQP